MVTCYLASILALILCFVAASIGNDTDLDFFSVTLTLDIVKKKMK